MFKLTIDQETFIYRNLSDVKITLSYYWHMFDQRFQEQKNGIYSKIYFFNEHNIALSTLVHVHKHQTYVSFTETKIWTWIQIYNLKLNCHQTQNATDRQINVIDHIPRAHGVCATSHNGRILAGNNTHKKYGAKSTRRFINAYDNLNFTKADTISTYGECIRHRNRCHDDYVDYYCDYEDCRGHQSFGWKKSTKRKHQYKPIK